MKISSLKKIILESLDLPPSQQEPPAEEEDSFESKIASLAITENWEQASALVKSMLQVPGSLDLMLLSKHIVRMLSNVPQGWPQIHANSFASMFVSDGRFKNAKILSFQFNNITSKDWELRVIRSSRFLLMANSKETVEEAFFELMNMFYQQEANI